jgi:GNAT superfamily N-acetyltransferase
MKILILRKHLAAVPADLEPSAGFVISRCEMDDMDAWLALRHRAFAAETPPARTWEEADFLREFVGPYGVLLRPTWIARPTDGPADALCGAISLSPPVSRDHEAAVHWLMVDPAWRRRRIGTLLLRTVESFCWQQGWRRLRLESHPGWVSAVEFYTRQGFKLA